MKDILILVLTNFWPFVAALFLLSMAGSVLSAVIKAFARVIAAFRRGGV